MCAWPCETPAREATKRGSWPGIHGPRFSFEKERNMKRERGDLRVEMGGRRGTVLHVEAGRMLVRWDDMSLEEEWVPLTVEAEKAGEVIIKEVGS